MSWRGQIAGAFGFGTAPFAIHRADQALARTAIRAAKAEGASREEFAREIALYARRYISSESVLRERLRQDAAALDRLWKVSSFAEPASAVRRLSARRRPTPAVAHEQRPVQQDGRRAEDDRKPLARRQRGGN